MNAKLTTGEKLKDLRVERHLRLDELSKEVYISASTLSNYENDENYDISAANILALAEYFDVSADYLLGRTENREGTLSDIDELGLDDETIDLLKKNRINRRLLCELIKDNGFINFLTDIEIYVDGIAQAQINNINSYVDGIRKEILETCHPDDNDKYIATLEAAKIDEGNYFADRIHKDIDEIIFRIRDAHKDDKTTMQEPSAAKEILKSMNAANKFKGSNDEKLVFFVCDMLEINYKSLAKDEIKSLAAVVKKSKKLKTGANNRGKYARR